MKSTLQGYIKQGVTEKIVLLTGPRQCGKTTLSKQLYDSYDYFNYDAADNRLALKEMSWDRSKAIIIFMISHMSTMMTARISKI